MFACHHMVRAKGNYSLVCGPKYLHLQGVGRDKGGGAIGYLGRRNDDVMVMMKMILLYEKHSRPLVSSIF